MDDETTETSGREGLRSGDQLIGAVEGHPQPLIYILCDKKLQGVILFYVFYVDFSIV